MDQFSVFLKLAEFMTAIPLFIRAGLTATP